MNRKIRKRLVAADPVPADALLPGEVAGRAEPEARKRVAEILADGAGTALALRLDPDCIPALADPPAERTERTPRWILGWLRRGRPRCRSPAGRKGEPSESESPFVSLCVLRRMARWLNRRSQRHYRLRYSSTYYGELQHLGLLRLRWEDCRPARK